MQKNIHKFPKTQRTVINNLIETANNNKKSNSALSISAYIQAINLLIEELEKSDRINKYLLKERRRHQSKNIEDAT